MMLWCGLLITKNHKTMTNVSAFQNCVCSTQQPLLYPAAYFMSLILHVSPAHVNNNHAEGHVFSRPSGHMLFPLLSTFPHPLLFLHSDTSHLSVSDLWPSGRLLEPAPSLQSLMDSLVNSFTVIISIPSYLCLTHFLYRYFLWKTKVSSCGLDRACSWSLCFSVHSIASRFPLFVGKIEKSFIAHVQLVLWGKPVGVGAKEV